MRRLLWVPLYLVSWFVLASVLVVGLPLWAALLLVIPPALFILAVDPAPRPILTRCDCPRCDQPDDAV
jgi:hypothetical protein